MSPLGWLIGLVLPACAAAGANGVPVPPPLDLAHFERPTSPNTALAAPDGAGVRPDVVTPLYPVPASRLWSEVNRVAASRPRTYQLAADEAGLQASWVVRSAVFNFPDVITAAVMPRGPDASTVAIYSRSIYGRSDFGVNRARVRDWLAALDAAFPSVRPSAEK